MSMKLRLLHLIHFLSKSSDENHPVSTADIRAELAGKGCPVTVQTLRTDIHSLREAGYDIQVNEQEGLATTYSWLDREWSAPELQILIDAVSSSQFITIEKSNHLISKLSEMAGPSYVKDLRPQILVSEHIKAPNKKILLNVQAIRKAIQNNRMITFKYLQYSVPEKSQIPKHLGTPEENYILSPYATILNSDRFYLVGWSEKRKCICTYRIDRMDHVEQISRERVPEPEDLHIQKYTERVFRMYDGLEEEVHLRCQHQILDQMIDKFGPGIELSNITSETFDFSVPVSISGTFFAWVFQYVGEMVIIAPAHIRKAYTEYLQKALDSVESTQFGIAVSP